MQDQCELVKYQRGTDPENGCRHREFRYSPVDGQSHHRDYGNHDQNHTDHHVMDVEAASCRDIARLPPLAGFVAVGVAADVPHDGAGDEEGADERDEAEHQRHPAVRYVEAPVQRQVHPENLRRPGRDVPGIWFGAPRWADSLACDMSRLAPRTRGAQIAPCTRGAETPPAGGTGWWPTVAWR